MNQYFLINLYLSTYYFLKIFCTSMAGVSLIPISNILHYLKGYTRTASEAEEATWSFHRHAHGHNQLHCFADPTVSWDVAGHYKFEWRKNGDTLMEKNQSQQQDLIEYIEELTKPPGLVLTLGKIDVSILMDLYIIVINKLVFLFVFTSHTNYSLM